METISTIFESVGLVGDTLNIITFLLFCVILFVVISWGTGMLNVEWKGKDKKKK